MEQMNTDGLQIVRIDFEAPDLPESVKKTHPICYMDGDTYCCLLGPDPMEGIFGKGASLKEALEAFDKNYAELLEHPVTGDPVSDFIQQRHI